jgi:hypothetical protein
VAIANLRPSATGTYNNWILGAGASKVAAVDPGNPVAHDDDATYIRIGAAPGASPACRQSFVLDTGIPAAMDAINSLALNTRARSDGAAEVESYHHFMRTGTGGGALEGSESPPYQIYDAPGSSYRTFTTAAYPPPAGGSWAVGDIVAGNLQMILAVQFDSALSFRVTSTWVAMDFDAPASGGGGYLAIMWSILGPVFGAAVTLQEVARAAGLMARQGLLLTPDEVRAAWVDLRTAPRRTYFLPPRA